MFFSLYQDISHRLYVLDTVITRACCFVSTRVGIIMVTSGTKPDSGVTAVALGVAVAKDTNSCCTRTF